MQNDWIQAPESAINYAKMINGNHGVYYWLSNTGYWAIGDNDHTEYHEFDLEFAGGENFARVDFEVISARRNTESIPVFSQAMCDAGELPSVGMECKYHDVSRDILVLIKYKSDWVIVFQQIEEGYAKHVEISKPVDEVKFKPLTPPKTDEEKAIESMMDSFLDDSLIKRRIKRLFERIKNNEVHGVTWSKS